MTSTAIRKVFEGVAERRQMFRIFDRHAQRPNRFKDDAGAVRSTPRRFRLSESVAKVSIISLRWRIYRHYGYWRE